MAIAWLGAAAGRAVSLALDGAGARYNLGSIVFNALIGLTLTLPSFQVGKIIMRGMNLV